MNATIRRFTVALAAAVFALVSCETEQSGSDGSFSGKECYGLWINGASAWSVSDATVQTSSNSKTLRYRVGDDNFENYFVLSLSAVPTVGQQVTGDLTYTVSGSTQSLSGLSFEVKKQDSNGKTWLWNSSKSIGAVIRVRN